MVEQFSQHYLALGWHKLVRLDSFFLASDIGGRDAAFPKGSHGSGSTAVSFLVCDSKEMHRWLRSEVIPLRKRFKKSASVSFKEIKRRDPFLELFIKSVNDLDGFLVSVVFPAKWDLPRDVLCKSLDTSFQDVIGAWERRFSNSFQVLVWSLLGLLDRQTLGSQLECGWIVDTESSLSKEDGYPTALSLLLSAIKQRNDVCIEGRVYPKEDFQPQLHEKTRLSQKDVAKHILAIPDLFAGYSSQMLAEFRHRYGTEGEGLVLDIPKIASERFNLIQDGLFGTTGRLKKAIFCFDTNSSRLLMTDISRS